MQYRYKATVILAVAGIVMFQAGCRNDSYGDRLKTATLSGDEKSERTGVFLNKDSLSELKRLFVCGDADATSFVRNIIQKADLAMKTAPVSVSEKLQTPPSGSKNDYMSLSIYWWPNPITGKPYIHKDGRRNPEADDYDAPRLSRMCSEVYCLSLAYELTGREKYARRAADQLRVWFVDPVTRMNPHMKYAQRIPGINQGSRQGIIETVCLAIKVLDAAALLRQSGILPPEDVEAIGVWVNDYLEWLIYSRQGSRERCRDNNHGIWYDVQVAALSQFIGNQATSKVVFDHFSERLDRQELADGVMPRELRRTKSFDYTVYNLRAMFLLAITAEQTGVDLWRATGQKGQGIRHALLFAAENVLSGEGWRWPQIGMVNKDRLLVYLCLAERVYEDVHFGVLAEKINASEAAMYRSAPIALLKIQIVGI